ncbi:hypothetical protein BLA6860_07602 [Burkholderia lata]|uniref:hypothetical protein n=1 Tax=Burkholderia lata (strain ATCC 17760 / DSM 23089 / LMG 22485 / NCIMB 9086 / R18194 / 383) TaxID=482957 RepID=UPI001452D30F|nr:hypothetical protein [Burkholderia lata]VWC48470.1 hypothetical protein BLA6860_07602 [Burkholderia lata]
MTKITGGNTAPVDKQTTTPSSSNDSQSTRRSNDRPTGSATLNALNNLSTPHTRRNDVTQQAASHMEQPDATYYSAAVFGVSSVLQHGQYGITEGSHNSVVGNLDGLSKGTQTHTGAHMNESKSFGKDAVEHFRQGEYRDAAMTAAGSAINAVASMTVGPARDFETARKDPRPEISVAASASLHQDFATLPSPTRTTHE